MLTASSCTSVLQNTLGRHFYKKNYLPNPVVRQSDFYVETPYEFHDGWIILNIQLNRNPKIYRFLFDTGARSFVSDSVAKELNLIPQSYKKSVDINGADVYSALYKVNLSIGTFQVDNLGVLSKSDFSNLTMNCYPIDGIIGANVLNESVFHFDTDRKMLIITHSVARIPIEKRSIKSKLIRKWNGDSFVKLTINGEKGKFLFDTGSANLLFIDQKNAGKQTPVKQRTGLLGGLHSSKTVTATFYEIESAKIGKHELSGFNGNYSIGYANSMNNMGGTILEKYNVTIDRSNRRLYLAPTAPQGEHVKPRIPNMKLHWESGKVFVSALTVDGDLQKRGLKLNDTVVSINNIPVDSFSSYCDFELFRDSLMAELQQKDFVLKIESGDSEREYTILEKTLYK